MKLAYVMSGKETLHRFATFIQLLKIRKLVEVLIFLKKVPIYILWSSIVEFSRVKQSGAVFGVVNVVDYHFCYTLPMQMTEKKRFSIVARMKSFNHAFRGIGIIFRTQPNASIQCLIALVVIVLGVWLKISAGEWALLIFAIFSVLAAEGFNTALEIDIDLTSPDEHPYARDTKDVAAGAVLLTVFGAILVGLIVFVPKILHLFDF